ncbi:hypothetical protein SYJ56_22510 [Algoriphagus sp. D3-2-R+10]|uniref:hypothetical protein n=1 Tax=Algoriphagus aurantiacus TaxID=3103948 RepID=UPI002B3DDA01|nr:hypothetical protein [Algoriphagus sp. D3-2-R+10]MEB2778103.1 hypothetical protein [Algoriphagus sp. D3-2-R+10]
MKRTILVLSFVLIIFKISAQSHTVEKSITGIQIGFLGANIYNEARLADVFVLRSQFALFPGLFGGEAYPNTGLVLFPELSLQPKYYYNLKKRGNDGKVTTNNSANFISIDFKYLPDWFSVFNHDNIPVGNSIGIIPTWGLRRNFSENLNYEFNLGLGYAVYLNNNSGNTSGVMYNLGIKIGYDF